MIQTVTGGLAQSISGKILMHEHISCVSNDMLHTFGSKWLDKNILVEKASKILSDLKSIYGVEMVVDGTPIDAGRDMRVLREVSEKSGVKIVASTGLYNYPSMITYGRDETELAEWILEEIENGAEGTDIKPGILKCACDDFGITKENEKRIRAIGIVQAKTGLPLYLHSLHQGVTVNKAIKILKECGVGSNKVVIGHVGLRCELDYIKEIVEQGCYVCIDQCHCRCDNLDEIAKTLVKLSKMTISEKILLSNDVCIYCDFGTKEDCWITKERIPETLGYIFEKVYVKFLEFGGEEAAWKRMLNENPIRFLEYSYELGGLR